MTVAATQGLSFATLLKLGRVSNLPTVWTNVLAGTVLAGGDWRSGRIGFVLIAMSLFYIGGMYLNDYFDRAVDARERPTRPIPAGDISAAAVKSLREKTGLPMMECKKALAESKGDEEAAIRWLREQGIPLEKPDRGSRRIIATYDYGDASGALTFFAPAMTGTLHSNGWRKPPPCLPASSFRSSSVCRGSGRSTRLRWRRVPESSRSAASSASRRYRRWSLRSAAAT